MPPLQLLMSFIGIIIVLFGAYYATYYIGMKASGRNSKINRSGSRKIRLLDRFAISKDKSFCIVEIAGKVYIIGVSNQSMTLIDTLDAQEFAHNAAESGDIAARNTVSGSGLYSNKLVNKLATFMSARMGNERSTQDDAGKRSETFADSMKSAREKNTPGQPDRKDAGRPDGSEGE